MRLAYRYQVLIDSGMLESGPAWLAILWVQSGWCDTSESLVNTPASVAKQVYNRLHDTVYLQVDK
jgi:hypothetical protein